MRERQKGDAGVGRVKAEIDGGDVLVGGDVAVGERDALGLAGGSGGVDERGQVARLDGVDQGVEDGIALGAASVGAGDKLAQGDGALRARRASIITIRSSWVWERTAFSLSNCWRVETTAMRQPASRSSSAICSPVSVG